MKNTNITIDEILKKKHIFFDVDGVIVSSVPFYAKMIRQIIVDLGGEGVPEDISFLVGYSAEKTISPFLPIEKLQEFHKLFEKRLIESHGEKHELTEGVINLLDHLKNKGKKMAAVSSRSRGEFDSLFSHYPELEKIFEITVSRDDVKMIKPDPEPINFALEYFGINGKDTVMIGDSEHDLGAAIAVGMPFLGVCTGVLSAQDWQNKGVSYVEKVGDIIN